MVPVYMYMPRNLCESDSRAKVGVRRITSLLTVVISFLNKMYLDEFKGAC